MVSVFQDSISLRQTSEALGVQRVIKTSRPSVDDICINGVVAHLYFLQQEQVSTLTQSMYVFSVHPTLEPHLWTRVFLLSGAYVCNPAHHGRWTDGPLRQAQGQHEEPKTDELKWKRIALVNLWMGGSRILRRSRCDRQLQWRPPPPCNPPTPSTTGTPDTLQRNHQSAISQVRSQ